MVRMDNLSAAIMTSWIFPGNSNGFHWIYPTSFVPFPRGGGLRRNTQSALGFVKVGTFYNVLILLLTVQYPSENHYSAHSRLF